MNGDIGIGKIITSERGRDAIHIAVVPVVAGEHLDPGQHVGADGHSDNPVGIVDPFLREPVRAGQRFYLFMYPGTITSLRHEWTHPAFGGVEVADESRAWIEAFAAELDQTYSRLMAAAEYWLQGERDKGRRPGGYNSNYTYDNSETYKDVDEAKWPIFWHHYEIVTGVKVADHEATFFTCSC